MTTATVPRHAGLATGLTLLIPITLSTMAIVLLAPVVPQLMAEFKGVPNADFLVPMVLTTPALCIALLSPVAGALGDYFGRRRLLLASLFCYGFVGILPIFIKSLLLILISRIAVGVAEALIMCMTTTLIGDYFSGAMRDKWLAAQTAVASLSAIFFFNVGGLLGSLGWRTPFWVYSSAFLMLAATLAFTWEPGETPTATPEDQHLGNTSWTRFPWAQMAGIVLVTVFGSVLFYTVQIQASSGLASHGLSDPARIGFLTSVASLGVPIGTYVYGKLKHNYVGRLLFAEFFILGVGFVVMSLGSTVPAFLVGCAINQFGAGLLLPTLLVWAMGQLSFEFRARGIGVWQSAFALGQFLSPVAITLISRRTGTLLSSFQWLGYAGLVAAAVAATFVLTQKSRLKASAVA